MPTVNVNQSSCEHLQNIADILAKARRVVVVTGAGISTNSGIPDFRSENGLYSMIQAQYDAALKDPPWEVNKIDDIDDRPKKKRRVTERWYYRLETADGRIVEDRCKTPSISDESAVERHLSVDSAREIETVSTEIHNQHPPDPSQQLHKDCTEATRNSKPCRVTGPHDDTEECGRASSSPPSSNQTSWTPRSSRAEPCSSPLSSPPPFMSSPPWSQGKEPSFKSHRKRPREALDTSKPRSPPSSQPLHLHPAHERDHSVEPSSQSSATSQLVVEIPSHSTDSHKSPPRHPRTRTLQRQRSDPLLSRSDTADSSSSQSSSRSSLPNMKGRDLFDSMIWQDPYTTSIFYMFISSLRRKIRNEVTATTHTHKFIKSLRDTGRLVRNYTQNIDCLEEREGLCTELKRGPGRKSRFKQKIEKSPPSNRDGCQDGGVECVLLHGSLSDLRCGVCAKISDWDEAREEATLSGSAPDCPKCEDYSNARQGRGRRSLAVGRLRPDVVLYGEEHPNASLIAPLVTHDLALGPDVLLILGTSLRVHGLKVMIREFAKCVHSRSGTVIFVNQTKPSESVWGDVIDFHVEWDCDAWVLDLKTRREDIWCPQVKGSEQTKTRSQNGRKPKKQHKRSQAQRDSISNGVHVTFAILDKLRLFKDVEGRIASRKQLWPRPAPRSARPSASIAGTLRNKDPEPSKSQLAVEIPVMTTADPKVQAYVLNKVPPVRLDTAHEPREKYLSIEINPEGVKSTMKPAIWQYAHERAPALSERPAKIQDNCANIERNAFPSKSGIQNFQPSLLTHPPAGLPRDMMTGGMRKSQRLRAGEIVQAEKAFMPAQTFRSPKMKISSILETPPKDRRKRLVAE